MACVVTLSDDMFSNRPNNMSRSPSSPVRFATTIVFKKPTVFVEVLGSSSSLLKTVSKSAAFAVVFAVILSVGFVVLGASRMLGATTKGSASRPCGSPCAYTRKLQLLRRAMRPTDCLTGGSRRGGAALRQVHVQTTSRPPQTTSGCAREAVLGDSVVYGG